MSLLLISFGYFLWGSLIELFFYLASNKERWLNAITYSRKNWLYGKKTSLNSKTVLVDELTSTTLECNCGYNRFLVF